MNDRWVRKTFVPVAILVAIVSDCTCLRADEVEYFRDIKPILKAKCWSCHGALKQEANLRLDTIQFMHHGGDSGPALLQGDELNSELLRRVTAADTSERMPPEGEPVSLEQIRRVKAWLKSRPRAVADEKAQADPKMHWAFQPLQRIDAAGGRHRIDQFVDAKLAAAGLQRSQPADETSLIRRMFLDLHGLPPSPRQIADWQTALLAARDKEGRNDVSRALIDELLSSDRYGERWAQHWLDIVRYADTHGFEVNTPRPNAWPYRDYVIDAFNSDKPYDQFVFEQLAGDATGADAATGFMVAAAALLPGQIGKDEESKRLARQDELDEIIIGTSATFLGMTVGCARCHDHKFDPIPQTDYYALQAFFAGVDYGDREIKGESYEKRMSDAHALQAEMESLRRQLEAFTARSFTGRTIIVDDEDSESVVLLKQKNGHGTNPEGTGRGYRDDAGDELRFGNLSRGRYTWFDNKAGQDVFTWNPAAEGRFRLWVSWGVHGSGVHTHDARYVLDADGDLTTTDDQHDLATADQYYFVGVTDGETEQKPLWSGLLDTGVHDFTATSCVVLRGGETGTGITADVIVLQESDGADELTSSLPMLREPVDPLKTTERFEPVAAKFVRFTSLETVDNNRHEPCLDELEIFTAGAESRNVAIAEYGTRATSSGNYSETGQHQLKHINDGKYGNSFSWISNQPGAGWVQLEFSEIETVDRIEWARDREGKFKDRLPVNYRIETSINGQQWTLVASAADRIPMGTPYNATKSLLRNSPRAGEHNLPVLAGKLKRLEKQLAQLRKPELVFAGRFRPPDKTFVLRRGDPEQPTTEIKPHVLTAISDLELSIDASDQERRIALARWIAAPNNPLTARVIANRIWQYHFGVGLVETSSDFGLNGVEPSHPELLDWLAAELIDNGWSIKKLHRLIMTSQTYRQASVQTAAGNVIDADDRLLWHFPSRRLEAESIRDCMLSVSGQLNLKVGGPGFDFFKTRGGLSGFPAVESFTDQEFRRMIYAHKIRMEPVPVFGAFDCPDAGLPTPRRSQSITAIQALNLFNSPFVVDQAEALADRCEAEGGAVSANQIRLAFQLVFGRSPSDTERSAVEGVVQQHGLATLCRALFNSNEFLFIP